MHDHITHLGVIHGALGIGAPHILGLRVIGKHPDQIERRKVGEFKSLRVAYAPAHNKVKLLHIGLVPLGRRRDPEPIISHVRNKETLPCILT